VVLSDALRGLTVLVMSRFRLLPPTCALALLALTAAIPLSVAAGTTPRVTVAAQRTFWYIRIHNKYFGAAFGTALVAHHARISIPSPGVLRLVQTNKVGTGRVSGRIACIAQRTGDQKHYACRWAILVARKAQYTGWSYVILYKPRGFNVEPGLSNCKPLVSGSTFCRRYPPPNG
jgi:hypothetical protein